MLEFNRYFTKNEPHTIVTKRRAAIEGPDGKEVFAQDDVEAPDFWSDRAVAIVASKYFHGKQGTPERESSVLSMVDRVARTITQWGREDGYFDDASALIFQQELYHSLLYQKAAFNSPVWFNVGVPGNDSPQSSACFILGIEDTIESIVNWYATESLIFKHGSGAGINISPLRSAKEFLSYGGRPSGPLSFMRAADSCAGVIKSGGKVRRAAKLVCMDDNHPDIWEFVSCKIESKKQADALRSAGFEMLLGDDRLGVPYTNSNHAVRLTDAFMNCAKGKATWPTLNRTNHKINHEYVASDLLQHIAAAVYFCGDPGVMFHDTINKWNTCLHDAGIKSANPCCEFNWFDDSACNLASLKLTAFLKNGKFDAESFGHAVDIMITAQDILIDRSSYPTKKIKENSKHYRPLGLGFTDLGALLMRTGIPYDSDQGRDFAASIASFMTARAYQMSANLACVKGASPAFERNKEHVFRIFEQHEEAAGNCEHYEGDSLALRALQIWHGMLATKAPIRNMQTTLLAPAGTISFMMDCDTTGIEPELALVKYKQMVGGGVMRIVNRSIREGLIAVGSYGCEADEAIRLLEEKGTLENVIKDKYLPIFDCAFKAEGSDRCISPQAHIDMMAAVQSCISGAISKTVNLPAETTIDEIVDLIWVAYEKGIKAVTFYRDGSRYNQPLTTAKNKEPKEEVNGTKVKLLRKRLPAECRAYRYKFVVGGEEGYLHMGLHEDGSLGEIFITLSKEGSTIAGLMDTIATQTSIALQYGVPLEVICEKMKRQRFDPSGITNHPGIHFADSLVDFIGRYLEWRFLSNHNGDALTETSKDYPVAALDAMVSKQDSAITKQSSYTGQTCSYCGNAMVFNGKCYTCECGESEGCS